MPIKISDLPSVDAISGQEILPTVQDATTKKVDIDSIVAYAESNIAGLLPSGGSAGQTLTLNESLDPTWEDKITYRKILGEIRRSR